MNQAIHFPDREQWDESKQAVCFPVLVHGMQLTCAVSGYLYLGSPVKQIRPLTEAEREGLKYSANNYVKWKDEYLDQGSQTQP